MKRALQLLLIINTSLFAQNGKIFDTYKSEIDSTNESHGTIFPKPFQSYNYIKTHRGIEVYETYKIKEYSTNESHGSIFSKPFPAYIIINNKIYSTYKNKDSYTNESYGTIFTKPFESKQIFNINTNPKSNNPISTKQLEPKQIYIINTNINTKSHDNLKVIYKTKYKEPLPRYNGEGDITYGE